MSYAAERASIESRFAANWLGTPMTDVVFDNVSYTPTVGTPYVRFNIKNGESQRITIGTREHRAAGAIIVQIFTPFNGGSNAARLLADQAAAIFRDQHFDDILCRSPSLTVVGGSGDWFQVNVSIPYQRDEVFA